MRKTIYATLLLLLLEAFWFSLKTNKVSSSEWGILETRFAAGFPIQAISYTIKQTTGDSVTALALYSENVRWWPGLWISFSIFLFDILIALAVLLFFRWLLGFQSGRTVLLGLVLGIFFGIFINFGIHRHSQGDFFSENPITWFNYFLFLVALPAIVGFFTRRSNWQSPVLFLVAMLVIFPWASLWCDQFRTGYQFTLDPHSRKIWSEPTFEEMVVVPFMMGCVAIVFVFLMRKTWPHTFKKRVTTS